MAFKKKPVTGMKDILPNEMIIRDYVINVIKSTYARFGFTSIETPALEHLSNLNSKQGGDNEKLIFRTLKRGEKLKINENSSADDLSEEGLRYDLTVPLSRYYANNIEELPSPFKSLQIGNVWRADRPQRGRYRQFMQCDIDILGDPSNMAEIDLILATSTCLSNLGFDNFTIRINDRRILRSMANYAGIDETLHDIAFIELDKMDKIGISGVRTNLQSHNFSDAQINKFLEIFAKIEEYETNFLSNGGKLEDINISSDLYPTLSEASNVLGDYLDNEISDNLNEIIEIVNKTKSAKFELMFDTTLVRGMSYYTGTIFEISMDELGSSVGGGGRYDRMIAKFSGVDVPACGFSIGFERIILIMMESNFSISSDSQSKAYLLDKKLDSNRKAEILSQATKERLDGMNVMIQTMKKNKKFQKEQLTNMGYNDIIEIFE